MESALNIPLPVFNRSKLHSASTEKANKPLNDKKHQFNGAYDLVVNDNFSLRLFINENNGGLAMRLTLITFMSTCPNVYTTRKSTLRYFYFETDKHDLFKRIILGLIDSMDLATKQYSEITTAINWEDLFANVCKHCDVELINKTTLSLIDEELDIALNEDKIDLNLSKIDSVCLPNFSALTGQLEEQILRYISRHIITVSFKRIIDTGSRLVDKNNPEELFRFSLKDFPQLESTVNEIKSLVTALPANKIRKRLRKQIAETKALTKQRFLSDFETFGEMIISQYSNSIIIKQNFKGFQAKGKVFRDVDIFRFTCIKLKAAKDFDKLPHAVLLNKAKDLMIQSLFDYVKQNKQLFGYC